MSLNCTLYHNVDACTSCDKTHFLKKGKCLSCSKRQRIFQQMYKMQLSRKICFKRMEMFILIAYNYTIRIDATMAKFYENYDLVRDQIYMVIQNGDNQMVTFFDNYQGPVYLIDQVQSLNRDSNLYSKMMTTFLVGGTIGVLPILQISFTSTIISIQNEQSNIGLIIGLALGLIISIFIILGIALGAVIYRKKMKQKNKVASLQQTAQNIDNNNEKNQQKIKRFDCQKDQLRKI